ncbi:MAG: hypothetical protein PCFJNLEI_03909 [Verrucomicrobiae bacterium]|nr:hypothetical protein [Verrucomicrobiae bacterium]
MKTNAHSPWPVLNRYDANHLRRIALPLGGIGTGTVSLGGRGDLRDWELVNRPAKGFIPPAEGRIGPFFAVWVKPKGGQPVARLLEGPLPLETYEGSMGATPLNHGLPRFRDCEFHAAYPLGQVVLSDPAMPVDARLEAFNPLIPGDADASGIPMVALRYVLHNRTGKPLEAAICGMVPNFIGADGENSTGVDWLGAQQFSARYKGNQNEFRQGRGVHGVYLFSKQLDPTFVQWGTLALAVLGQRAAAVSYRTAWAEKGWGDSTLDFWEDFLADGRLQERAQGKEGAPKATLATRFTIPARGTKSVTFLLTWHFPNRQNWFPPRPEDRSAESSRPLTPFVIAPRVSELLPFAGAIAGLEYPPTLTVSPRVFANAQQFCNVRDEILARGTANTLVYFQTKIRCAEPMELDALLGYDGPVALWVNGAKRFIDSHGTNPAAPDTVRVPFSVPAGDHEILVALSSNAGKAWGIYLRFERKNVPQHTATVLLPVLLDAPPANKPAAAAAVWTGNYYATQYQDAWDVAVKVAPRLRELERRTVAFVRAFGDSDLPAAVKEAALNNVSTLRTQTTFRTADGFLFGWEGCADHVGSCFGSCTHVWNYENALGFLFGDLSRGMRRVEFEHATLPSGLMCFRVGLPLTNAHEFPKAAADGQLGVIMRFYRDWKLSGDEAFLRSLWPKVRKALEFCWIPGGWDADQDGVMEGCQHNTMDVEYYGPNPQMGIWYLGALRAATAMAEHVGDDDFAQTCRSLFERGRDWIEKNLFNGEYYEHQIWSPKGPIADGLRIGMGGSEVVPEYQLGAGCLVDQLVGQYMAHAIGLGYLIDPGHAKTTLRSIMKYNFKESFHDHFNQLRSYVLGDEAALLMASYPRGNRPAVPFPYYTEVMTGFEYTAAVGMLYEGLTADGLKCIRAIRARYDGRKRSPWNEAECGHHYARAMASWTAVLALTGFQYSAVTGTMEFAASKRPVTWFWSTGAAWGTCRQVPHHGNIQVMLRVEHGTVRLRRLRLAGRGESAIKERVLRAGQQLQLRCQG